MNRLPMTTRRRALGIGMAVAMSGLATACGAPEPVRPGTMPEAATGSCASDGTVSITYIGDSLTNGTDQDSGRTSRFPAIITRRLLVPARILASNGSGYVQVGPGGGARAFPAQASLVRPDTSLVVILGSRNDMHSDEAIAEVRARARETYRIVRERAPGAKLLVVGPPWINADPSEAILAVRDELEAATQDASIDFVDPIKEGWFAEHEDILDDGRSRLIAPDRIHPNDEGHAYLADRLFPYVTERICNS